MYTFDDRDGNSLAPRPEATASMMRAYMLLEKVKECLSKYL
jgi:histidyl-tRNA synthetase